MQKKPRSDTLQDPLHRSDTYPPTSHHMGPLVGKVHVDAIYNTSPDITGQLFTRREPEASVPTLRPRSIENLRPRSVNYELQDSMLLSEPRHHVSMQARSEISTVTEPAYDQMYREKIASLLPRPDSRFSKPPPPFEEPRRDGSSSQRAHTLSSEQVYDQDHSRFVRSELPTNSEHLSSQHLPRQGEHDDYKTSNPMSNGDNSIISPSTSYRENTESGRSPVKRPRGTVMDDHINAEKRVKYDDSIPKDKWSNNKFPSHSDQGDINMIHNKKRM
jgi:hypothetical protein